MRETILITGGSGLIGRHLSTKLMAEGYAVNWLTRQVEPTISIPQYTWDYRNRKIDIEAIERADAIIHLAGANINDRRWSESWKREIYYSRVLSTRFLHETIACTNHKIKTFIAGSAVGYYGALTTDKIYQEDDPSGIDFLAKTCHDWENASIEMSNLKISTVCIRTGVVMADDSAAFQKISLPIRYGIGAAIGSGKQYFPWIHIDDLCGIYLKALEDETLCGAYNAVAPQHLTNAELTAAIARHFKKPLWLPNIPGFVIKILFGEVSESLLNGSRISSQKILDKGYQFKYPTFQSAFPE